MQTPSPSLTRYWLLLGAAALAIAGLFALVLVVARTPQLAALPMFASLFHQSLVVHVDLSVLVWFLAIACLLWSKQSSPSRFFLPLEEGALMCFAIGTLAMAVSPFDPRGEALMSNYIPVIHSPIFFIGLALIACGVGLMLLRLLGSKINDSPTHFAISSAAFTTFIALFAFLLSYRQMPSIIDGQQYYDLLFWGGGHILQFTHVQIAMVCWLLLINALGQNFRVNSKWLYALFSIAPLSAIFALLIYPAYGVTEWQHRTFFTNLMIVNNGIAPMILALWILPWLWKNRQLRRERNRALWSALFMSAILFIYGGVLGGLIEGQNVVIPAHYHGSIVAITLAFMGAAYLWLPGFGYRDVGNWKLAYWQPIVYGIGQLMHVSGLAYSGGYGVLRKTPGAIEHINPSVKIALGFMGLGGLLAIIGGFMFVVVVWRAVFQKSLVIPA